MRAPVPVGPAVRRVAVLVRATAAPAQPAAANTSKVDTSLTPKQLGFTMPGGLTELLPAARCAIACAIRC